MDRISTYIVDDEEKSIEGLKQLFQNFFPEFEVIGSAGSIADAVSDLKTLNPDIIFLDVEMGRESGFDLLEVTDELMAQVVFLTAHEEYALRAIKFAALDYILKPPALSELKGLIERFRNISNTGQGKNIRNMLGNFGTEERNDHKITLPVADGHVFKRVGDILYVRADGSYSHFFFRDGEELLVSKNLKHFSDLLSEYGFYRIHHSTMINLNYIKRIGKSAGGYVVMEDDREFSISKSRKADFLSLIQL